MFKTPYDTLACIYYRSLDDIQRALAPTLGTPNESIEILTMTGPLDNRQHQRCIYASNALIDGVLDVPYFAHPMVISLKGADLMHHVVVDTRDCTRREAMGGFKITSPNDFQFAKSRAVLQMRWLVDFDQSSESAYHPFAVELYSRWLSETLTRRFNLDIEQSMRVKALSAFMFISMHKQTKDLADFQLPELQMYITRICKVPTTVMSGLELNGYIEDVKEFCDLLTTQLDTNRLDGLNPATLFGLMKGSWFGKNAGEIVNVSLEHPPTFNALLYAAANSPVFQKTYLGRMVKENLKSNEALAFVRTISQLINEKDA